MPHALTMHKYQHPCLRRDSNQQLDAATINPVTSAAWLSDHTKPLTRRTSLACSFSWCMLCYIADFRTGVNDGR